jgi:uncharacterized coiled-coil DUF342 family protein
MVDKKTEEEEVVDEAISKIDQIRKAAGEFRKNVAGIAKNMNVESKDWRARVYQTFITQKEYCSN